LALALPIAAQTDEVPKEPPPAQAEPETETTPAEPAATKTTSEIEEPPLHRWGGFTVSVAAWDPALIGAEEEIATIVQGGFLQSIFASSSPRVKESLQVSYHLPKDVGSIVARYDSMNHEDTLQYYSPGNFVFFESRGFPSFLGAFDNSRADGVDSATLRKSREFRLEYQRKAFESKRAHATWGVGYRELTHSRALGIIYWAIAPNLPPLLPPVIPPTGDPLRLQPFPDFVSQESSFSGHGLGASFDIAFPVHPRVAIISGLSFGLIRGEARSQYQSISSYYYSVTPNNPITAQELIDILEAGDPATVAQVDQQFTGIGSGEQAAFQMAQSYDVYLGVEVNAWRGLKVFGTLREVYYVNVGEYVVVQPGLSNQRTSLNAGYEGYVVGLSWRF
jgi:hypothetical protein